MIDAFVEWLRRLNKSGESSYAVNEMLLWPELSVELRESRTSFGGDRPSLCEQFAEELCEILRDTMYATSRQPDHMSPALSGSVGIWELLGGHTPFPVPFMGLAHVGRLMSDEDFSRRMQAADHEYRSDPSQVVTFDEQKSIFFKHAKNHPLINCGVRSHRDWFTRYVIFEMPVKMTEDQKTYQQLNRRQTEAVKAFWAKRGTGG